MITLRSSVETVYDPTGTTVLYVRRIVRARFPGGVPTNPRGMLPPPEPGMLRSVVNVTVTDGDTVEYETQDSRAHHTFDGDTPVVGG